MLPVIDALEARETRSPAMKKLTTTMMQETLNKYDGRLTVGLATGRAFIACWMGPGMCCWSRR
jgi:hypothetical protein